VVAGNWKMNHVSDTALAFAQDLSAASGFWGGVDVALFPPATLLMVLHRVLAGTGVRLGGQACHQEARGAFTGEVSVAMLRDAGCEHVLVGHSERRALFGETDAVVRAKLGAALVGGLNPVLCVGETEQEREGGRTEAVLERQLATALDGLDATAASRLWVAYEPVWAIGTGRTATPGMAQEAHAFTRSRLGHAWGAETAEGVPILYGGSVKPDNFGRLLEERDIDGGLVGGASLAAADFLALVEAAAPTV